MSEWRAVPVEPGEIERIRRSPGIEQALNGYFEEAREWGKSRHTPQRLYDAETTLIKAMLAAAPRPDYIEHPLDDPPFEPLTDAELGKPDQLPPRPSEQGRTEPKPEIDGGPGIVDPQTGRRSRYKPQCPS